MILHRPWTTPQMHSLGRLHRLSVVLCVVLVRSLPQWPCIVCLTLSNLPALLLAHAAEQGMQGIMVIHPFMTAKPLSGLLRMLQPCTVLLDIEHV